MGWGFNSPVSLCSVDKFWRSADCVAVCFASVGWGKFEIVGVRLSGSGKDITGSQLLWHVSKRRMLRRVL